MSDQSRNRILERMREGLPATPFPGSDFSVIAEKQWPPAARVKMLRERLESVNGQVHQCGRDGWVAELRNLLSGKQVGSLLYAPGTQHGRELEKSWPGNDAALPSLLSTMEEDVDFRERVFDVDASLTGTIGGIAETGTLVLWPTIQEPRLMSLAPPVHIALLDAVNIQNTFWEMVNQLEWAADMPTNALLISGPSKTADIEQHLSYGVHGPKELIVLIRD
jgi:L-lactate dehydrogenase complex protein LldG